MNTSRPQMIQGSPENVATLNIRATKVTSVMFDSCRRENGTPIKASPETIKDLRSVFAEVDAAHGSCADGTCPAALRRAATQRELSVDQLARALWETDREVEAFIDRVGDTKMPRDARSLELASAGAQLDKVAAIAWDRDELGARTKWTKRAEEVLLLVWDRQ